GPYAPPAYPPPPPGRRPGAPAMPLGLNAPIPPLFAYPPQDEGGARLGQVDAVLSNGGFRRLNTAVVGSLPDGGQAAFTFDALPGVCYTIIALGGSPSVRDLNLVAYSPYGLPVAHDVRDDNPPLAQYRASEGG